jgi:uncharacterized phage-like protein YoqJ
MIHEVIKKWIKPTKHLLLQKNLKDAAQARLLAHEPEGLKLRLIQHRLGTKKWKNFLILLLQPKEPQFL